MPPRQKVLDYGTKIAVPISAVVTAVLAVALSDHTVLLDTKARMDRTIDRLDAVVQTFETTIDKCAAKTEKLDLDVAMLHSDVRVLEAKLNIYLQK